MIGIWKNIDLITKEFMGKKTSLPHFINKFFQGGPPLSMDDIKTETQGFMSFYDTFLEINLFDLFSEAITPNLER